MIKELFIRIRLDGDKIQTISKRNGFSEDTSGILEVASLLQNAANIELKKLEISSQYKIPFKEPEDKDKGFTIL